MSGRLPRLSGVVAMVDTAGEGGVFVPSIFAEATLVGATIQTVVNRVSVCQFILPFRITVRNIVVNITVLDAGNFCAYAIYSADGNTVMLESGAISTAAVAAVNAPIAAVTLEPGPYFAAWTADGITAAARHQTTATAQAWMNKNSDRVGRAANPSVASVFPATLGAITASAINSMIAYLEP